MPDTADLFTSGPWVAFPLTQGAWGVHHASEHRSGGMHVEVHCLNRHTVEAVEQAKANATLVAAAPDMLAALRACCEPTEPGQDCCLPADLYNMVCAAIAKARGKA
jgi:hypothetical protein